MQPGDVYLTTTAYEYATSPDAVMSQVKPNVLGQLEAAPTAAG